MVRVGVTVRKHSASVDCTPHIILPVGNFPHSAIRNLRVATKAARFVTAAHTLSHDSIYRTIFSIQQMLLHTTTPVIFLVGQCNR